MFGRIQGPEILRLIPFCPVQRMTYEDKAKQNGFGWKQALGLGA
jgi:hypothetical protein